MAKKQDFRIGFHDPRGSISDETLKMQLLQDTARKAKSFFGKIKKNKRLRYVGNGLFGSETINLEEIHAGLGKSDAFVFLPSDDLDHDLKLLSMFVGVQTGDENMFTTAIDGKKRQKPVIVVGESGYWDPVLKLIEQTKFISDNHKENIVIPIHSTSPDDIVAGIALALEREKPVKKRHHDAHEVEPDQHTKQANPVNDMAWYKTTNPEPKYKVCVFCSASNRYFVPDESGNAPEDKRHNLAFQLGAALAQAGYGVVSGAGSGNMMGDVVLGAQSKNGWTAGSNTPHIRQLEGLPGGVDAYIDMPDIYKRMKVMIEGSDAFIVAPGGAGSIQEFLALMHYKKRNSALMKGKPVVILNPKDENGKGYWDALIAYAKHRGLENMFKVASTAEEAERMISEEMKTLNRPLSTSWSELVKRQKKRPDTEPDFTMAV